MSRISGTICTMRLCLNSVMSGTTDSVMNHLTTMEKLWLEESVCTGPSSSVDDDGNRISLCGSVSPVTSEDHSDYTSGSLVSIKKYGDEVLFKDSTYGQPGLITNADNNPPDAQLDPDQKSSLVALEFSNKNSYILEMCQYAKYPRTTLMAGISNMALETCQPRHQLPLARCRCLRQVRLCVMVSVSRTSLSATELASLA